MEQPHLVKVQLKFKAHKSALWQQHTNLITRMKSAAEVLKVAFTHQRIVTRGHQVPLAIAARKL